MSNWPLIDADERGKRRDLIAPPNPKTPSAYLGVVPRLNRDPGQCSLDTEANRDVIR
jgi:hypothetical protein